MSLGCTNHCKGCFSPQTWDFNSGKPFTEATLERLLEEVKKPYCAGLSLSGGDPLNPLNAPTVSWICQNVKEACPNKEIWCWTGHKLEHILDDETWARPLKHIDVVIDGKFDEALADPYRLVWRGSSNQSLWRKVNGEWVKID